MKWKVFSAILAIFGIGLIGGYVFHDVWNADNQSVPTLESQSKQIRDMEGYAYTNPLLECEVAEGALNARKENFRDDLETHINQINKERGLSEVAVYYRDLNNGPTFGVDEQGEFFPASLLKVPLMMAYYRWSEQDQAVLSKKISFNKPYDFGVSVVIQPRENLQSGMEYTIEELINRMIRYSDNQATHLLVQHLPQEKITSLFKAIGVGDDVIRDGRAKLTVKEYSGFFRILFNSSYLSRENSEKALRLLASTDYNDALPAGVPASVAVAHKFGEAGTEDVERQLHDCGIVYFPDHPYLACIMTRGRDVEQLKDSIVSISRFIYDKIDEQY